MEYILEAYIALLMIGYLVWTGFTIYFVMISKKVNDGATIVGKIIWYHGVTWIITMVVVVGLTMSLLLAEYISMVLKIKLMAG